MSVKGFPGLRWIHWPMNGYWSYKEFLKSKLNITITNYDISCAWIVHDSPHLVTPFLNDTRSKLWRTEDAIYPNYPPDNETGSLWENRIILVWLIPQTTFNLLIYHSLQRIKYGTKGFCGTFTSDMRSSIMFALSYIDHFIILMCHYPLFVQVKGIVLFFFLSSIWKHWCKSVLSCITFVFTTIIYKFLSSIIRCCCHIFVN